MTSTKAEGDGGSLHGKRVWIAGHTGMVGSALVRRLARERCELLLVGHGELDLTRQRETEIWMRQARPDVIVVAAARVGGIMANARYPADFLFDNVMIALNVMHAAHELGVERLLWLGSSCIYPRDASQPIAEASLLTGPLEATNEAYAVAKIAGLKLAEAYATQHGRRFFSAMPANLYGPNDNFDPETAHVMPALIRRLHEARIERRKSVSIWGSGRPLREFLHVDDAADACVFLLDHYRDTAPINIGSGHEISILELARLVARVVGYHGELVCDTTKPDGTPRKILDTGRLHELGWRPRIGLEQGMRDLYRGWLATLAETRSAAAAIA